MSHVSLQDFLKGVDVSSYLSLKNSGVKYYDYDGNELGNVEYFTFLKSCGVNYIRLRVWNDPYDSDGNVMAEEIMIWHLQSQWVNGHPKQGLGY